MLKMWRRVSFQLRPLAPWRFAIQLGRPDVAGESLRSSSVCAIQRIARSFSVDSSIHSSSSFGGVMAHTKKRVEDIMPIATGLEREDLEAELQGRKRFDMDPPVGPFGSKEAPAVIESIYDKRIVGCPGGVGEDEHDVVWFWLEKGKPHECPVCFQYFALKVIGPGGPPDGHGDGHEHHH